MFSFTPAQLSDPDIADLKLFLLRWNLEVSCLWYVRMAETHVTAFEISNLSIYILIYIYVYIFICLTVFM